MVTISGGVVNAVGGDVATAIGSSDYGACASVTISGGTILRPAGGKTGIGASQHSPSGGGAVISGGAVYRSADEFSPAARNGVGLAVNLVDFNLQLPNAKIEDFEVMRGGEAYAYGVNDIYTDGNGHLRIWLPDGEYEFVADGERWVATVDGDYAFAELDLIGVTVNGADIGKISGEGWTYYRKQKTFVLESAGPFTVGGNARGVLCSVTNACDVTLDSLSLDNSSVANRPGFKVVDGADVALTLVGENVLKGGNDAAGLSVTNGTSVTIGGDGSLAATGGGYGAGIGGGKDEAVGSVNIVGGTVTAVGGDRAAGIGGGLGGTGCAIAICGGYVTATGGSYGAAIGSGDQRSQYTATGDSIAISGGVIRVAAPAQAAGIGASDYGSCGAVTISGGTILSTGGGLVRIGSGGNARAASVTISGGSIDSSSDKVSPAASNATERVWCVTVPGLEPNTKVDGLEVRLAPGYSAVAYGTDHIFADADGKIYVWLPAGGYRFLVSQSGHDDLDLVADVNGADTDAAPFVPALVGVTVGGKDIGCGYGDGWGFSGGIVHLTGAGPFEIAGSANDMGIIAETNCAVTLNGLSLDASGVSRLSAFAIMSGVSVELTLADANSLKSGEECAGLQVPAGAAVTIGGEGSLNATGGDFGAGIGGARNVDGNAGDITIVGGTVRATGGRSSAGIGGGDGGNGGTVAITGGDVTANGDSNAAGIGSGSGGTGEILSGGAVAISGGTVSANGGINAAAIGGGLFSNSGTISISGGVVTANGGQSGAGIGGGQYGNCEAIVISGGHVSATSQSYAAAIGGGGASGSYGGSAGAIRITGGTVVASANQSSNYAPTDIGAGSGGGARGSVLVTGGSVRATTRGIVAPAASNAAERVWCVAFSGFTPNAAVDLGELKLNGGVWNYGVESIFADAEGKVYLWLPEGDNAVRVGGVLWRANVTGDAVTEAVLYEGYHTTGVLVDGVDAARGCGEGWEWWPSPNTLTISGQGGCTLSGANTSTGFKVVVASDATVTLDGLNLNASESPLRLDSGVSATLALGEHESVLRAEFVAYPALRVPEGSALTITNVAENGKLTAIGGADSAGIGGGRGGAVGTIRITGGTVVARSGEAYGDECCQNAAGAGIGSGYNGTSGDIYITGGRVFAYGGAHDGEPWGSYLGAGIGGGDSSKSQGCRIVISGGTVVSRGGRVDSSDKFAADIGDGFGDASGSQVNGYTVIVSGGSVHPVHSGKQQFTQSKVDGENVPRNAVGTNVFYVPVDVGAANRRVQFAGLENYGTNDIWSDGGGRVYLWLPDGTPHPTPTLLSARLGGGVEGALYDFLANGYHCTVTAAEGGGLVASSAKMDCSGIVINSFAVEDGVIRMNVSAEPETWLAGFLETVTVRASETLPVPDNGGTRIDLTDANRTVEADGSVTITMPLPPSSGNMFYRVVNE